MQLKAEKAMFFWVVTVWKSVPLAGQQRQIRSYPSSEENTSDTEERIHASM